jgi:DNA-binding transcriptional ArsR family regulator
MRYQKVSNRKLIDIYTQNGFRALADSTRRDILQRLAGGEHTIAQLTEHFDMTRAAVKKRLTVLLWLTIPILTNAIWLHAPKTPWLKDSQLKCLVLTLVIY